MKQVFVQGLDLGWYRQQVIRQGSLSERVFASTGQSQWQLTCDRDGRIRGKGQGPTSGPQVFVVKSPVRVGSAASLLTLGEDGARVREDLWIYARSDGHCQVVNHLSVEKYLEGLVNSEFSSRWSEAGVDAQVVAARTYAYYQMQHPADRGFQAHYDVDSTIKDQVYGGVAREDARAARSVQRTRGLVLTVRENRGRRAQDVPVKAFYHSTCGGQTELPDRVWGRAYAGLRRRVQCDYCRSSPRYEWSVELKSNEVARALADGARREGLPKDWPRQAPQFLERARLAHMSVMADPITARAKDVETDWVSATGQRLRLKLSAPTFRSWVGPSKLPSTTFRPSASRFPTGVDSAGAPVALEGRGFGHGVGMCQWGAKVMGEKGYAWRQILKHYYPDASVTALW